MRCGFFSWMGGGGGGAMALAGGVGNKWSVCWKRGGARRSGVNYRTCICDMGR